jgi:MFS superfamily sulfate permease-like transporter
MAVGFMQSYALGKRFAEHANYKIDADQELIALGLVKIGGRYFNL